MGSMPGPAAAGSGLRWRVRYRAHWRSACRCSADAAKLRLRRMWLGEFGLAMKRVWRIDLANHPPLRCRSDRPIWRRFSGSCCTDVLPQPCSILYPLPPAPFPLDLSGSGEHSCACPFGPPRIALSWRHQRSRSGPNGQPPESSQLERCRSRTVLSEAHPAYVIGTGRRPRHGLASLALQRLAPGEGFRPTQVKGNVLGGALRPIPGAAEGTRYQVAPCLADGEETGHHLRTRRVVDAAGIVLRHHEFAKRAAEAVHHPGDLHAPAFGIV